MNPLELAARMADHAENDDLPLAIQMDCHAAARILIDRFIGPTKSDLKLQPLSPAALAGLATLGVFK